MPQPSHSSDSDDDHVLHINTVTDDNASKPSPVAINPMEQEDIEPQESSTENDWIRHVAQGAKMIFTAGSQGFVLFNAANNVLGTILAGDPTIQASRMTAAVLPVVLGVPTSVLSILRQMGVTAAESADQFSQALTVAIGSANFLMLLESQLITSGIREQERYNGIPSVYHNVTAYLNALGNTACLPYFNVTAINATYYGQNASDVNLVLPVCIPDWAGVLENVLPLLLGACWGGQWAYMQWNKRCPDQPRSLMNRFLTHPVPLRTSASLAAASVLQGMDYLVTTAVGSDPNAAVNAWSRYAVTAMGLIVGALFAKNPMAQELFRYLSLSTVFTGWLLTYFISSEAPAIYGQAVIDEQLFLWTLVVPVLLSLLEVAVFKYRNRTVESPDEELPLLGAAEMPGYEGVAVASSSSSDSSDDAENPVRLSRLLSTGHSHPVFRTVDVRPYQSLPVVLMDSTVTP